MNYILRFHRAVEEDVRHAREWYEGRETGLGARFELAYFSTLDSIARSAEAPRPTFRIFRRVLVQKFPYAVWYRVDGNLATIVLVFDCRRDPRFLRRVLRSR